MLPVTNHAVSISRKGKYITRPMPQTKKTAEAAYRQNHALLKLLFDLEFLRSDVAMLDHAIEKFRTLGASRR